MIFLLLARTVTIKNACSPHEKKARRLRVINYSIIQTKQKQKQQKKKKKKKHPPKIKCIDSGVHPRVSTLMQPSFKERKKSELLESGDCTTATQPRQSTHYSNNLSNKQKNEKQKDGDYS